MAVSTLTSIAQKPKPGERQSKAYLKSFADLYERAASAGLQPPQVLEVEQSILGACMIDKLAANRVVEIIGYRTFEDSPFYRDAHTLIYHAIMNLVAGETTVDIMEVTNKLRLDGVLEEVGGPSYLVELTSKVVTTANVASHSRIVLEMYLLRELIRTCEETKLRAFLREEDTFELLDKAESNLFRLSEYRQKKGARDINTIAHGAIEYLEKVHDSDRHITGVTSGLIDLDEITSGWQKSDLIILAARPSQGKTALALKLAREAAVIPPKDERIATAFFSLEMSDEQLVLRMICSEAGIDLQRARKGKLQPNEWKQVAGAIKNLTEAPLFIDDTPSITPLELRAKCRRLKQTNNIGLIIVDYLQLMEAGKNMDSREREISYISRSLKALAKELNIPVIALSQLNRSLESRSEKHKRPMLSDLRESGAIEQDADLVLFIYRPETYGIEMDELGRTTQKVAEIIVGKQRNGPIGTARTVFDNTTGDFSNLIQHNIFDQ